MGWGVVVGAGRTSAGGMPGATHADRNAHIRMRKMPNLVMAAPNLSYGLMMGKIEARSSWVIEQGVGSW